MKVRVIEPKVKTVHEKKRVCAYARVSTVCKEQESSFDNQILYYRERIQNNPEWEIVEIFADRGISGTGDRRPEFQRMLRMARNGMIDMIITKSISRFARNTTIVLELIREFKKLGVDVLFEKENIRTSTLDGELMLSVLSSLAQQESESISENIKWRVKEKFKKGESIICSRMFLGYELNKDNKFVINIKQAEIVKRIFREYLNGKGSTRIANDLNKDGIPTLRNKRWHSSCILLILKNEKYKGELVLQKYYTPTYLKKRTYRNNGNEDKYIIKNNHEAIIDPKVWDEVQKVINQRARSKGNIHGDRKKYCNRYKYTGMLYCEKCGATLKRRVWNKGKPYEEVVWQCSKYLREGKKACLGLAVKEISLNKIRFEGKIIIQEVYRNGKKYYSYSSKEES